MPTDPDCVGEPVLCSCFPFRYIRAVSRIARKHQALVYIDNTFCTPIYQQPLDMGRIS